MTLQGAESGMPVARRVQGRPLPAIATERAQRIVAAGVSGVTIIVGGDPGTVFEYGGPGFQIVGAGSAGARLRDDEPGAPGRCRQYRGRLHRVLDMLRRSGVHAGRRVLSEHSVDEMLRDHTSGATRTPTDFVAAKDPPLRPRQLV